MISEHFHRAWLPVINLLLLFSSCLNSPIDEAEYSHDAQIYAFSMSSASDTAGLLQATKFTIDQINGNIFNKEPLPYQFHVDSVLLNISGFDLYNPFTLVQLHLYPDSISFWIPSDSVATDRLYGITTIAADGITSKYYNFTLNIYQEDPYELIWEHKISDYLPTPVTSQKTIAFKDRFITYFNSGSTIQAMYTAASDGITWQAASLNGVPPTLHLPSLMATPDAVFGLDVTTGTVYRSNDGDNWNPVTTTYPVRAIYGELPLATKGDILAAVEINDTLITFAETDDFTVVNLLNELPEGFPVEDFSATKVDASTSYSIKYLILSGGTTKDNIPNNDMWVMEEHDGNITHILSRKPDSVSVNGSTLFFYDDKPYMMIASSEKNRLLYSPNYGLDWVPTAENQSFPAEFSQRINASVITDSANYIWIFGGISATQTQLSDVWRGRLNKFAAD